MKKQSGYELHPGSIFKMVHYSRRRRIIPEGLFYRTIQIKR
jgi:hypothetical protein